MSNTVVNETDFLCFSDWSVDFNFNDIKTAAMSVPNGKRRPVFRNETHLAPRDDIECPLRQRLGLYEPLVGQHRFDDRIRAAASRHHCHRGYGRRPECPESVTARRGPLRRTADLD